MEKSFGRELTKAILIAAAGVILIPALAIAPGLGYAIRPFLKKKYYPSRINKTLHHLQKQQLISIREENGKVRIELSDNGKKKVLAYKLEEMKLKEGKWDGWWRIIIFDIPEGQRTARDFLRYKLKDLNFYMFQKSVLITPWNCRNEINFIKHFYEVEDYVQLVLAKKFDGEEKVKNYFGL